MGLNEIGDPSWIDGPKEGGCHENDDCYKCVHCHYHHAKDNPDGALKELGTGDYWCVTCAREKKPFEINEWEPKFGAYDWVVRGQSLKAITLELSLEFKKNIITILGPNNPYVIALLSNDHSVVRVITDTIIYLISDFELKINDRLSELERMIKNENKN